MAPMMFGFGVQRRQMIDAELDRFVSEMPQLGMTRLILVGDLIHRNKLSPGSNIELIVVQETEEPFHRRSEFWVSHLRPSIGTLFHVYTESEFSNLEDTDPLILQALHYGERLYG